LSLTNS